MNTIAIAYLAILAAWHLTKAIPDDGTRMDRQHWLQLALAINLGVLIVLGVVE